MILPVIVTEHILVFFVSGSQNHKLHVITAELVHDTLYQIQSLLIRQAGNNAHHKFLFIDRKAKLCLKLLLILAFFLAEIPGIVRLRDKLVGFRIELVIINAIHNTAQVAGTGAHETVKTFAVERHLDLLCVSLAYRGDGIRKDNAAL